MRGPGTGYRYAASRNQRDTHDANQKVQLHLPQPLRLSKPLKSVNESFKIGTRASRVSLCVNYTTQQVYH